MSYSGTPLVLGTPSSGVATNLTGTATGLTAGIATVANTVSSANEASDTTCFPLFITASGTQSLQPKNNTALTYDASTGNLGASSFNNMGVSVSGTTIQLSSISPGSIYEFSHVGSLMTITNVFGGSIQFDAGTVCSGTNTGDQTSVSGNAGTATKLATARAINGTNFDGSAAITVTAAAGTLTGATLNSSVTASSLTSVGTITSGIWNSTSQYAFSAYNSVEDLNVTGDGTVYTVICDTEIFDQGSGYNNSTGVFTAQITGRYHLVANIQLRQVNGTDVGANIVTSNRTYAIADINSAAKDASSNLIVRGTAFADMDAGDTASMTVGVFAGAKTTDVFGTTAPYTFFQGWLVC